MECRVSSDALFFAEPSLNPVLTQDHPNGWAEGDVIKITTWAPEGTTFVQGMNVSFFKSADKEDFGANLARALRLFSTSSIPGSATRSSRHLSETSNAPRTFPRCATGGGQCDFGHSFCFTQALAISMCFEFLLFSITGIVVYRYAGQFATAPGYGSLAGSRLGAVAAGFTLPTILIVGILYSLVTSRAIFFQVSTISGVKKRASVTKQGHKADSAFSAMADLPRGLRTPHSPYLEGLEHLDLYCLGWLGKCRSFCGSP